MIMNTASSINQLSQQDKKELLASLLKNKQNNNKTFPLSLGQQRIWFLEQLKLNIPLHNIPVAYHLKGKINTVLLEKSLQRIVDRHESLRTRIEIEDNSPVQKIIPKITVKLPVIDVTNFSGERQSDEVEKLKTEIATIVFDISEAPLWRFQLLRLGGEHYVLLLVFHHIIFDGASIGILMQELATFYDAFLNNQSFPTLKSPKQYSQFTISQEKWLQGQRNSLISYWQQQLSGDITSLQLPTQTSQINAISYKGGRESLIIDSSLTQKIKKLSHSSGVSLYTTLLAAFKVLLYQYTRQEDMIVCSPVARRYRCESRGVIGYFNNILPIRSQLKESISFQQLLKKVSQVTQEAYKYQDLPFQEIMLLPNLASISLTRAMFSVQNMDGISIQLPDIQVSHETLHNGSTNFDLFVFVEEKQEELLIGADFKKAIFTEVTIDQLLKNFQNLLNQLVDDPQLLLADLPNLQVNTMESPQARNPEKAKIRNRFIAPRNSEEFELQEIWQQVLNKSPISIMDSFFDLGGNSVIAAHLFLKIEESFNKKLPLSTLIEANTIEKLAEILKNEEWSNFWDSLIPIQPQGSKPPLFCCPGVYGNVIYYRSLALLLGLDQPFYGLQSKGLDGKEVPLSRLEDMARIHIEEIKTIQPHGPYYLGGHSFGAKLAFEIAQQLQSQGEKVALLALFDPEPPIVDRSLLTLIVKNLRTLLKLSLSKQLTYVWHKIKYHFTKLVRRSESVVRSSKVAQPAKTNKKLYNPKVLEANVTASRNYIPKSYSGKITIFRASEYSSLDISDLRKWKTIALEGVEVYQVPGDHHSLLKEPSIRVLAEILKKSLEKSQQSELLLKL